MLTEEVRNYLLTSVFNAAVRAGGAIMQIYKHRDDYDVTLKSDRTPITVADRAAHRTIREYLGQTRIPILSEEGREMGIRRALQLGDVLARGSARRYGGVHQGQQ